MLLQGSAAAGDEHGEPWPTLWDTYRQWGYVSMFGEAGCGTAMMRPLGYSLEAPPPTLALTLALALALALAQIRPNLTSTG